MKRFLSVLLTLTMLPFVFNSASAAPAVWGDADGNGTLEAKDAAITLQAVLNSQYIEASDVDNNGVLDTADVAIILQKILNSSYVMPVESTTVTTTETTTETTTTTTTVTTTTEATTTTTTEAPTETTTFDPSGIISEPYELTQNNLTGNGYFKTEGDFSASNSERIRLTTTNALTFTVAKGANVYITARHASNTDSAPRMLYLKDSTGKTVGQKTYQQSPEYTELLYAVKLEGTYTITASNHMNVTSVRVNFDDIEMPTETTTVRDMYEPATEIVTTGNRIEVKDFSSLKSAASQTNVDIYVMNDIDCSGQIRLDGKNANVNIIGVTQADGTSPSINFATFRDSTTSTGSSAAGFRIGGTHYNFKNLIVENAPDCGMRITGSGSGYCLIRDCVFRYNNNSGISVTSGGTDNTFVGVDSYRNGDIIQKCGNDADGFSVKLEAGNNHYFYNCRAWENSDDGWDSYDRGAAVGDIYYIECLAWNNGNPDIFTGEYDYANGYPLDKGLLYVQQILREYPDFETTYNNHQVTSWPKVTMTLYGNKKRTYDELYSSMWGGNPNGFKFGSAETPSSSYRYVENCIAFGHRGVVNQPVAKGYDQNNGYAHYDIINGLSFDNIQNYWMDRMNADSQTGTALSFGGKNSDASGNLNISTPAQAEQDNLRTKVNQYKDALYDKVYNDVIPGIVLCDVF